MFIETLRVLMFDCNHAYGLGNFRGWRYSLLGLYESEWLWANAANILYCDALIQLRKITVKQLRRQPAEFASPPHGSGMVDVEPILKLLVTMMDDEMLTHYLDGNWPLLPFGLEYQLYDNKACDSEREGGAFIGLLRRLGLNVEVHILRELEHFPGKLKPREYSWESGRRIVFEPHPIREWTQDGSRFMIRLRLAT